MVVEKEELLEVGIQYHLGEFPRKATEQEATREQINKSSEEGRNRNATLNKKRSIYRSSFDG
jgi:hypothetical protein